MEISGISLVLGKSEPDNEPQEIAPLDTTQETETIEEPSAPTAISQPTVTGLDAIKDEEFRESLKKLGQSIEAGTNKSKHY
jgi:hypothetical protein